MGINTTHYLNGNNQIITAMKVVIERLLQVELLPRQLQDQTRKSMWENIKLPKHSGEAQDYAHFCHTKTEGYDS